MEGFFEVVFDGRIVPGRDLAEVKANVANLFKAKPEAIERLFSGQPVTIKKDLDYPAALRYIAALKEAGALARFKQQEGGPSVARKASDSWSLAPVGTDLLGLRPAPPVPPPIDLSALSLAPVGADMAEHQDVVPVPVGDISSITLAEVGADIGTPRELIPLPEPDLSDLSVAEVGATLGAQRAVEPVKIGDISGITIAEVGAVLDTSEKKAPPPPPKTDHLKLG
ncbi:hypothetical protein HPT27_01810 [Permianibacter sp. IMCC34836]|uniref:hypothetical protein n=1 Tax=Permianibacter fluminis TaxID=2738515 RepID=UPI0015559474|nr:hypothetical protein [Permianibacter fluminis]NQD35738.1 hypothetical protein [Permianibacter fluminis]